MNAAALPRSLSAAFHLNFAYGSNLDAGLMAMRCNGHSRRVGPAVLRGWRLAFEGFAPREGGFVPGVFATVVRAPGAEVHGLVYEVTDRFGLAALDGAEGVPSLYIRENVTVELASGFSVEASTYLHQGGHYGPPERRYLDGILRGYLREGFPWGKLASAHLTATRLSGRPIGGAR